MSLEQDLRQIVLKNAKKFGKANEKSVLGGVLKNFPDLRSDIAATRQLVAKIVADVNALSNDDLQREISALPEEVKKVVGPKQLKELKNTKPGKVVMRFAPSPSGPLHVGHAYLLSLNAQYAKKYNGKFIFRIEDTNPENIYEPAYELCVQDAQWLSHVDQIIVQSDRLSIYHSYAKKLIDGNGAYICTCNSDDFRTLVFKKEACPCRELGVEEHKDRYQKMFDGYKPGEAVMRAKSDIGHKNPAMRDFPLMRINDHPHPRTGKSNRVWPLMNLAVTCDDIELGVTHVIRAKDHRDNALRQEHMYRFFDAPIPETLFVGRINFTDMRVSCSKTKLAIQEGQFTGWEDIRIPFLKPLRMRGFQPGAFDRWSVEVGTSGTDKTVEQAAYFKSLNAFNKEIIDPKSDRYYFIKEPVQINIIGAEPRTIELPKHPEMKERGHRTMSIDADFYIEKEDADRLDVGLHRLMDALNFTKEGNAYKFDSIAYESYKADGKKIIHWLPANSDLVRVRVMMPDATELIGYGEPSLRDVVDIGTTVQFERFGFCCYQGKKGDDHVFWFTHK